MKNCRMCNGEQFDEVLTIKDLPLGFPVTPEEAAKGNVWNRAMALELCRTCYLGQTLSDVPDDKLAEENLYLSGSARAVLEHDDAFSNEYLSELGLSTDDLILEIGCSDGTLLGKITQAGFKNVMGVDPSLHEDKSYPFETVRSFFDADAVAKLKEAGKLPKCIIANYVIELVPDIVRFFADVASLMKPDSLFVVEIPSLVDFIKNRRIDGFVHLRCLWFTLHSLVHVYRQSGLTVNRADHLSDYRGGTLRVVGWKTDGVQPLSESVAHALEVEARELSPESLEHFKNQVHQLHGKIRSKLEQLRAEGYTVYGYGGGHKACTLVNWLGITEKQMVASFDNDPCKQNRLIPGSNIPIISVNEIKERLNMGKTAIVHMAIDHVSEVEDFLKQRLHPGSRILHVLPVPREVAV